MLESLKAMVVLLTSFTIIAAAASNVIMTTVSESAVIRQLLRNESYNSTNDELSVPTTSNHGGNISLDPGTYLEPSSTLHSGTKEINSQLDASLVDKSASLALENYSTDVTNELTTSMQSLSKNSIDESSVMTTIALVSNITLDTISTKVKKNSQGLDLESLVNNTIASSFKFTKNGDTTTQSIDSQKTTTNVHETGGEAESHLNTDLLIDYEFSTAKEKTTSPHSLDFLEDAEASVEDTVPSMNDIIDKNDTEKPMTKTIILPATRGELARIGDEIGLSQQRRKIAAAPTTEASNIFLTEVANIVSRTSPERESTSTTTPKSTSFRTLNIFGLSKFSAVMVVIGGLVATSAIITCFVHLKKKSGEKNYRRKHRLKLLHDSDTDFDD